MRVAIVNYVWDPRVAEPDAALDAFATLTGLAGALAGAGLEVTVSQRFGSDATRVRGGVSYVFRADAGRAQPRWWFAGCHELHRLAAAAEPDVAHVNGLMSPLLLGALRGALPHGCAMAVQDHGGVPPQRLSRLRRWWRRAGLGRADALLVATEPQVASFRASGIVPRSLPVYDLMEGSTSFAPQPRDDARRASAVEGRPALLWVGRLDANKDPLCVLRGFAAFAATAPTAHLTMVYPDGGLEPDVRALVGDDPRLSGRVTLRGRVPHAQLPAFYSAADLFVSGSHSEGSGYAAIEAMACAAVPVLTDIPAFRGLTAEGSVGVLWRPGDAASLAAALATASRAADDPVRAGVRARFEQALSWSAIGARARAIYHRVIAARRARG